MYAGTVFIAVNMPKQLEAILFGEINYTDKKIAIGTIGSRKSEVLYLSEYTSMLTYLCTPECTSTQKMCLTSMKRFCTAE